MMNFLTGLGSVCIVLNFVGYLFLRDVPPFKGLISVCLIFFGGVCLMIVAYKRNYGLPK